MVRYSVFKDGKRKIMTFSYDDGHIEEDKRLIDIFNRYNIKATFHLNGINYTDTDKNRLKEISEMYKGHEIACHTLNHGFPAQTPSPSLIGEIMKDRLILEKIAGYPVLGMSYPFGSFDKRVENVMKNCGILYSRTTSPDPKMKLPENFLCWNPTCHHKDFEKNLDLFLENIDSLWSREILYVWGHSFEFKTDEDFNKMELLIKKAANNDKIWYATNMEIYTYMNALKQLRISADEKIFCNPTDTDLWVELNYCPAKDSSKCDILKIPRGETVNVSHI